MQGALDELDKRGIAHEFDVRVAHRQPDAVAEYCRTARDRGLKVLICGAGFSARSRASAGAHGPAGDRRAASLVAVGADGLDALLAIAQIPPGVPVAASASTTRGTRQCSPRASSALPDTALADLAAQLVAIDSVNPA